MKTRYSILSGLLLLMLAVFNSACSNDIDTPATVANKTRLHVEATLAGTSASADEGTTRALGYNTTNDLITAKWRVGEEIAIFKTTAGTTNKIYQGKFSVSQVVDGRAVLDIEVTNAAENDEITLVFPAASVTNTEVGSVLEYADISQQDGRITTLAKKYDLCEGSTKLDANLKLATNRIEMTNKRAILGIRPNRSDNQMTMAKEIRIMLEDGTKYTATREEDTSDTLYFAMNPIPTKTKVHFEVDNKMGTWIQENMAKLQAGKYYYIMLYPKLVTENK